MPRGRTPNQVTPPSQVPRLNEAEIERDELAAHAVAVVQARYGAERDLVNQLLGQAQAFQASANLLRTFGVSKLAYVKENKLYQQLRGMRTPDSSELKGTWAEFCELLGMSDDKANEDIANLRSFGEAALEQMQRMGIGYRELRQYRKLPADQQTALIEVAKAGDKDALVDLAEEFIARGVKEKEALAKELQDANDRVESLAEDKQKLTAEKEALRKEARRLAKATPDQVADHLRDAIEAEARVALSHIMGTLRDGLEQLHAHAEANELSFEAWATGQIGQLEQALNELRGRLGIAQRSGADMTPGVPPWMNGLQERLNAMDGASGNGGH